MPHRPFHLLRSGLLAGSVCLSPSLALAAEDDGRLGLRYRALDEGLLVTSVSDDMGAADAGIVPGTLLVYAGDELLGRGRSDARALLIGPAGSSVELKVIDPLGDTPHSVTVERRLPGAHGGREVAERPPSVVAYRRAVRDGSRRKAVAAAEAMVADGFGGMQPRAAVGASLATAKRRGDRFARDVAHALAPGAGDDTALLQGLGRVLLHTGDADGARAMLERRVALTPPDLHLTDGQTADLGGTFQARALLIDATVQTGDRAAAADLTRDLFRTHRDPGVAELVGMAVEAPDVRWTAELPPIAPFSAKLLDGSTWSSADYGGKVVILNFWATWCGPCKRELPELAELYEQRKADGIEVLAVSTDTGPMEPVHAMADKLELPFSVGHAPELSEPFAVSALPAIRVLGPDGALHYSAKGFSEGAMEKLDHAIDQAQEAGADGGAPLATVWGPAADQLKLRQFFPVAGALGVAASSDTIAVGAVGSSPTLFGLDGMLLGEASVESTRGQPGARMGWIDGVVAADPGKLIVRKWDADGLMQWVRTVPEPVIDLTTTPHGVFVACAENLYVFDSNGNHLLTEPVALTDLATTPAGGVVGIGPASSVQGTVAAPVVPDLDSWDEEKGPPPLPLPIASVQVAPVSQPAHVLTAAGDGAGTVAQHIVSGNFGPDGARRVAVLRGDDRLLIVDPSGTVEVVAELRRGGPLAVVDFDGDGTDSLLVTIPDHGVAWLEFQAP